MAHRRVERIFDVPAGEGLPEAARLAATVHLPERPDPERPVLFLLPGGTYSRGYYDIRMAGFDGYSQAEHHACEGLVTIAIDHLGTGDSSNPGPGITFAAMAAACSGAVRHAVAELRAGALDPTVPPLPAETVIGVGQSMGGHVVARTQADHAVFDAVALLGSSFTQTRIGLKPGRRYPVRDTDPALVFEANREDSDVEGSFHWPGTPKALLDADRDLESLPPWRCREVPDCAHQLMLPGIMAREAAAIRSPVLLVYGEVDVTADPLADASMFVSTTDLWLKIVPRMAHMHNFAPSRLQVWRRLGVFAGAVARDRKRP